MALTLQDPGRGLTANCATKMPRLPVTREPQSVVEHEHSAHDHRELRGFASRGIPLALARSLEHE